MTYGATKRGAAVEFHDATSLLYYRERPHTTTYFAVSKITPYLAPSVLHLLGMCLLAIRDPSKIDLTQIQKVLFYFDSQFT